MKEYSHDNVKAKGREGMNEWTLKWWVTQFIDKKNNFILVYNKHNNNWLDNKK